MLKKGTLASKGFKNEKAIVERRANAANLWPPIWNLVADTPRLTKTIPENARFVVGYRQTKPDNDKVSKEA